jgi:FlaA1/EpsC-like NDP-sugar epimerase
MPEHLLLIGQARHLERLERQLALVDAPPTVLGRVLTDGGGGIHGTRDTTPADVETAIEIAIARRRPDAAIVCLPAAMTDLVTRIRTRLRRLGVADRFVPTLEDLIAGVGPRNLLDIDPASLLGRPARPTDDAAIDAVVTGRRVLVTGAGGSIGGEIARRVARHRPASLVLMDRSENALFEIDRRVAMIAPDLPRRAILHDVVEADRTREHLTAVRPDVVFHAAAHKHVPMMEDHPGAAIDNNLFGTLSVLDAAVHAGAERFVLISTDKAVNPVSVMGITKRLAELYVRHVDRTATTTCSMVRFGNVLGSAGSVLETWGSQLRAGGPITVTDPRMTRYFMTIPEAAALVIEAAGLVDPGTSRGEVFVLDMGEPVSIDAFARRFITAHGLVPVAAGDAGDAGDAGTSSGTVAIAYTGIRPGEKLHEDLGHHAESMRPTRHPGINAWVEPLPDPAMIDRVLDTLHRGRRVRDPRLLAAELRRIAADADAAMTAAARSPRGAARATSVAEVAPLRACEPVRATGRGTRGAEDAVA